MRLRHFHELRPICLVCRSRDPDVSSALTISHSIRESGEDILEGLLRCSNPQCQYEFPIIDGIPFLVPNLRQYLAANIEFLQARTDLSATTQSVLGDCCGPAAQFEVTRQQLSSYSWCHYGDLDPENSDTDAGSTASLLSTFATKDLGIAEGITLDLGCSVGRTTLELAQQTRGLALGVDVNISMLRLASAILRTGQVRFPRKRVGLVYDDRSFPVSFSESSNADFWACDAANLPFAGPLFSRCVCLNTLDSVPSPIALLHSIAQNTVADGMINLACPYDWSAAVTPVEAWIGGHSQRGEHGGLSDLILESVLSDDRNGLNGLFRVVHQQNDVPWIVRLHDRSRMTYSVHAISLRRI